MAADPYVQLEGVIKFGPVGGPVVDYSDQILSLVITRTREAVAQEPTFANASKSTAAGAHEFTVQINFKANPKSASSFWAELWDAVDTDEAELDFEANFATGATSATNPKFEGTIVVTSTDVGGTPGATRKQNPTFPGKGGTLVKTTS